MVKIRITSNGIIQEEGSGFIDETGTISKIVTSTPSIDNDVSVSGSMSIMSDLMVTGCVATASGFSVFDEPIVTEQPSPIADVTAGIVKDVEARATINAVLAVLRSYGLIDT